MDRIPGAREIRDPAAEAARLARARRGGPRTVAMTVERSGPTWLVTVDRGDGDVQALDLTGTERARLAGLLGATGTAASAEFTDEP